MLSIQSHVVRGYVGNRAATFPLQVCAASRPGLRNRPGVPVCGPAAGRPQPSPVTLARPQHRGPLRGRAPAEREAPARELWCTRHPRPYQLRAAGGSLET